uniref:Zinc finger protein 234 n=1 Tax=Cacopsylla melanoneura TaxID=428564 RepID=A0A8D9DT39_9HEMI
MTEEEWDVLCTSKCQICPKCNKTFASNRTMIRHIKSVHGTSVRNIPCEECGKTFTSEKYLHEHTKYVHKGIRSQYTVECHYCGVHKKSKKLLRAHISGHIGIPNYVCKKCGKSYSSAATLRIHTAEVHLLNSEKFKCDICDKEFVRKRNLNVHKNWVHGDEFHLCKICGAKVKGTLKTHMITHTGERKICCHICGKKLRGKLKEHLLTHTGERPHACEVCGGTFKSKWYLSVHMRKHNEKHNEEEKTKLTSSSDEHQCQRCRLCFISEESLNEHIRVRKH